MRGRHIAGTGSQDEVRKLLDELLEAQNSGDAPRLRTMLSERPDAVHIGTDAGDWQGIFGAIWPIRRFRCLNSVCTDDRSCLHWAISHDWPERLGGVTALHPARQARPGVRVVLLTQ